jgi:Outer membrane protein beta-barrel domain
MHYLLRKQIILLLLTSTAFVMHSYAQKRLYRMHREDMPYYFGITLGYNSSYLQASKSTAFLQSDSVLLAEPGSSGGIAMGLLATARLNDHFQVRVNPQLIIGGSRSIAYILGSAKPGEGSNQVQSLPATLVSFPFQVKFNSDRIGNFRTYLLGGLKYDLDLSSNSAARNAEDLVKLKRNNFGIEGGLGFNFYLPFVTISPEIKISYGLTNLHQLDPSLRYSNVLDRIQSRMIVFSIHLED